MKFARVAFCVCALLCAALTASAQTIDFNKDKAGEPPKGFSTALTGQGKAGVWVVTKDDARRIRAMCSRKLTPTRRATASRSAFTTASWPKTPTSA